MRWAQFKASTKITNVPVMEPFKGRRPNPYIGFHSRSLSSKNFLNSLSLAFLHIVIEVVNAYSCIMQPYSHRICSSRLMCNSVSRRNDEIHSQRMYLSKLKHHTSCKLLFICSFFILTKCA
ncbi:hypothetical protein L2E82_33903 [Cichorium intybus]|uniref:Uncharacterized protein n=1 Tax=Cichorium intybus TaxID=13427 RepID=A0ACB9BL97_CICIN|nr:hypothetical protein L2E82_33903 [Cichorium intybus]